MENQTQAPPPIEPPPPVTPLTSSPLPPSNPESQARTWNMLCHLSALSSLIGIPFGNILGPLLVWQIKKNEIPSVEVHGKAALNFQITATIAILATGFAAFALSFFCIGYLLFPLVGLLMLGALICTIIASIKANNGESYKYPCSIEFVK